MSIVMMAIGDFVYSLPYANIISVAHTYAADRCAEFLYRKTQSLRYVFKVKCCCAIVSLYGFDEFLGQIR